MASLLYSSYFKKYQENAWLLRAEEEEEQGDPDSQFLKALPGTWVQILQQAPSFLKKHFLDASSTFSTESCFSFGVVCGGGAGTQGLMSTRQMLYRQARSPALHNTLKRVIGR